MSGEQMSFTLLPWKWQKPNFEFTICLKISELGISKKQAVMKFIGKQDKNKRYTKN